MNKTFLSYLNQTQESILSYYRENPPFALSPTELMEGTFVYFERGGKRLRPAICKMAAGALGGKDAELAATPCALALELYHNWTLIHDDIIDHDDTRRGKSAVHKLIADRFSDSVSHEVAAEYGLDAAILAGDALHSAAIDYLSRLSDSGFTPPSVTLKIIRLLEGLYGPRVICGETVDTKNGLIHERDSLFCQTPEEVIRMMADKTGALFGISALSGALIGLKSPDENAPLPHALASFAESCGIAFQLQDDILGITSTQEKLGKPIGSDIREGKVTLLLLTSFENATKEEQDFLQKTVGKSKDEDEILRARSILLSRGGVEETKKRAAEYLATAEKSLAMLPPSPWKDLLGDWCEFMLNREF